MTIASRLTAALADRYRIERELGQGGMAIVYLAQDLKHDRKVALKVLKPELAAVLGAERFVQEIKTTAALSHPHILPLFDSGTADGFLFYVMPYIQGETIREKLTRETQFGVDEAVRVAREIADALDYAHRHGVIHRDIKPENILLHDGRPMVMDFGIALAVSAAAGGRMTETGLSLGTPHYMSPEQATAEKEITARSDVYSLASVLYEMLTGNPPHVGSSAQQVIMRIITEAPRPVTEVRKTVPPNVADAVARALEKLPADRFDSARAFAEALGDRAFTTSRGAAAVTGVPRGPAARWVVPASLALAGIAIVLAALGWVRPRDAVPVRVLRYVDAMIGDSLLSSSRRDLAISPDGNRIVYVSGTFATGIRLLVRERDQLQATPLSASERGISPSISPDGRRVAFLVQRGPQTFTLKTASIDGGPAVTIADPVGVFNGAWGTDGYIYVQGSPNSRFISRVPEGGGSVTAVTVLDSAKGETQHLGARPLGDGRRLLFIVVTRDSGSRVAIADLPSSSHRYVGVRAQQVWYASSGHLVYLTEQGSLMAVPFDEKRETVRGEPRVILEGFNADGAVDIDLSTSGTLVYAFGEDDGPDELVWVNRDGTLIPSPRWTADFADLALSPDGRQLVVGIRQRGITELWVRQIESGSMSRLTFATDGSSVEPTWTPNGSTVAFIQQRGSDISALQRRADGSTPATRLFSWSRPIEDLTWSPDGKQLLIEADNAGNRDVYALTVGVDSVPRPLLTSPFNENGATVSPDGRWLAYSSNESGRAEIYVRPFLDPSGSRVQVSNDGGRLPGWSKSGRELFYVRVGAPIAAARSATDSSRVRASMFAVDVRQGPAFSHGAPRGLFPREMGAISYWGVTPDAERFVLIRARSGGFGGRSQVVVVENWIEELKAAGVRKR